MNSRACYIAGMSAHLDYHNERAKRHCDLALRRAQTTEDSRDAVWGQLIVSLDLDLPEVETHLDRLLGLDDGSAVSEIRLAIARFLVAIRTGTLVGLDKFFESGEHLVPRITEPHMLSSFYSSRALLLAVEGRYEEALSASRTCERYARDVRLPFVVPHARRIRAMAELGLRHMSRCKQIVDWLDREAAKCGDVFLEVESRLIRSRILIAQGLASRAATVLEEPPARFPFVAERGEFLATAGLAFACSGQRQSALRAAHSAQAIASTVEVRTLIPCITAILAIQADLRDAHSSAQDAFRTALETGNIDSFVTAYRGYPPLLSAITTDPTLTEPLGAIVSRARDWPLAKGTNLAGLEGRRRPARLTPREEEVLGLIAQGLTNKEIAQTLFLSQATAKVHVRHILEKLGARSRTEAALRAAEITEDD